MLQHIVKGLHEEDFEQQPYSLDKVDVFISQVDAAKSAKDVLRVLKQHITNLGFDRFSYQVIVPPTGSAKDYYLGTYPDEWVKRYNEMKYISVDILGRLASTVSRPFKWSDAGPISSFTPLQQQLLYEAREFGLRSGAMIPLYGPGVIRALLTVSSEMLEEEFARFFVWQRHVLQLIASYTHERLVQLGYHETLPRGIPRLSPREVEILTYAAEGRSSEATASKLNISSQTVNTHINNIFVKLNVRNKSHAVSVAMAYGLIMPRVAPANI